MDWGTNQMDENYYPITFDGDSFIIVNNGTAPAPCKITIIPQIDFVVLTIEGVSKKPIKVQNVSVNDTVVIDGEERTITINDEPAFNSYDGWEFPKLQPGENHISIVNGAHIQISIEFNARYL